MTNENAEEDYAEQIRTVKEEYGADPEAAHRRMDAVLCEALRDYGEDELVDEFESATTWYG